MSAIVPTDGGAVGNTHEVAYGSVLLYVGALFLPLIGHLFHASPELLLDLQNVSTTVQSLAIGGAVAGRPPWIKQ